jgi:hypothetical protein
MNSKISTISFAPLPTKPMSAAKTPAIHLIQTIYANLFERCLDWPFKRSKAEQRNQFWEVIFLVILPSPR